MKMRGRQQQAAVCTEGAGGARRVWHTVNDKMAEAGHLQERGV